MFAFLAEHRTVTFGAPSTTNVVAPAIGTPITSVATAPAASNALPMAAPARLELAA